MKPGRGAQSPAPLHDDATRAVDLEIRHHIDELTDRLVANGWTEAAARAEAGRRFGDLTRFRSEMLSVTRSRERRTRLREWLVSLRADVRYGLRGLRRSPAFAVTVIATLGLGMGAAAAVFTILDALLLRPLPFRAADQLVTLNAALEGGGYVPFLFRDQIDRLDHAVDQLSPFAFYQQASVARTDGTEPEELQAIAVSHGLDELLGMHARLGRTFDEADARPGVRRALLSYPYWQRLGANTNVIGTTVRLDGEPWEIVGVLPRDFKFPVAGTPPALWLALGSDLALTGRERFGVVARLADGHTLGEVQQRMDALASALGRESQGEHGWRVALEPVGKWRANPDLKRGVWLLGAGVLLMLLIALTNGVNLVLFRAADRAAELAVRRALGAGTLRLLRQLLVEGWLLGLASGLCAMLLAQLAVRGLNRLLPDEFAFSSVYSFRIEQRVLLFAFLIAIAAGTVLGMLPGWRVLRPRPGLDLRTARNVTRRDARLHQLLSIAEVALAVALLATAGLLGRSLVRLMGNDTGFEPARLYVLSLSLPESRYASPAARGAFMQRLETELESARGVASATVANGIPPHVGFRFDIALQAEGMPALPGDPEMLLPVISAAPDYLPTIGGHLLAGRDLTAADYGTPDALIDDRLARLLWQGNAIGKRFRDSERAPWYTVVGVFRHMTLDGLDDRRAPYAVIRPRNPASAPSYASAGVRLKGNATPGVIRDVVRRLDPALPISRLEPVLAGLSQSIAQPRFLTGIMLTLSAAALVLAAIGIYGVLSYAVIQRRREVGIRMALGAQRRGVEGLFLRQGLLAAAAGVVIGVPSGLALSRLMRSLLFGVQPGDPVSLALVITIMLVVAALASRLPAHRAARTDPVHVLKAE